MLHPSRWLVMGVVELNNLLMRHKRVESPWGDTMAEVKRDDLLEVFWGKITRESSPFEYIGVYLVGIT
jgi:hypothetical protein